ncbi:hypothetical protein CNR33_00042 [Pseudomonas phage tabernarius]|uniref:Uncharacterized protein n=1 Tax=Pseudomonas phage tabernarius TaxID=2048978 RepID=A0A2H4P6T9_9CAUD|nr:hypothetical protein FDJ17_gp42 [Pseudomonas phage tabernarius]ATW57888.1 hypothetical protein CNR33_00042 [Pseudomonas phage tabernarius]
MKDSFVISLLADTLDKCAAILAVELGVDSIPVVQKDQPTQQGTNSAPTIFFQKLFDVPRGFPKATFGKDEETGEWMDGIQQAYETHFQISVLNWQDPTNENINTASDLVNGVFQLLMIESMRSTMKAKNLMVLRVDQVRNPSFENDKGQFEYHPNFDLVLTHNAMRRIKIDTTEVVEGTIRFVP